MPPTYSSLASRRVVETLNAWHEAASERARAASRTIFAGLLPGATGTATADEIADKILAPMYTTTEGEKPR